MGFRKRNAKRSDNRSSAKVIMGKPASQLSKEEKKILSARMAEIRSENDGKNTVQNTIPFLCMYQDGVCQVSENFFSLTVQFFDANYSISEFEEQNNIFSKYCDVINLFDNTIKFQLTFENQNRSKAKLVKTVQIPEQEDDFNAIRKEYSEMLTDKLLKGSNGQSARKFLTFGIESTSYKLHISKEQMKYVTNSGPGEGLIRYDKVLLPFTDKFPTDTEMYRLMTTKPTESA